MLLRLGPRFLEFVLEVVKRMQLRKFNTAAKGSNSGLEWFQLEGRRRHRLGRPEVNQESNFGIYIFHCSHQLNAMLKEADGSLQLIRMDKHNYFEALRVKLGWSS